MPQFTSEAPSLNFTIPYPVPKPSPIVGQVNVLVIAVEFKDYNHTLPIEAIANNTINQLNLYYNHISYGMASIVGKAVGWIRLPYRMADYGADNGPFVDDATGSGYPDTWQLLRDALPSVMKMTNLADYQEVFVLHAGNGEESSGRGDDIWSVTYMYWSQGTPYTSVEKFSVVPEFEARGLGTMGVYAHEFGHLLGLPDLYSSTAEEVGPWDLMARGAWNGKPAGTSPAEMLAWDRLFLGWITPAHLLNVTTQTRINATLDPIEINSSGIQAIRIHAPSQDSNHYYLVEVRQKIGFDVALPSTGVLITYMDETKENPVRVINAVQTSSTLNDAPFQVGQKYVDSQYNVVVSIVGTSGSSFSLIVDTLAPSPDVVVEDLSLNPPLVHPNDTVSLNIQVANEGTLNAKLFTVAVYLNETLFASRRISLNAGESQLIQLSWTPTNAGAYLFKVVLDPDKTLSESNRENNVKTLRVVVGHTLTLEVRPPQAGTDLEWWLVVNGVNETYTGIGEFQIGVVPGSNTLQIQPIIFAGPSSRYVFRQWSDNVTSNPRVIEVSSDMSLSADFSSQYLLSLQPNGGAVSPSGWYDPGTSVTISATSPSDVVENESRLIFLNWSGDVTSNSPTVVITMNQPHNATANWKTQYYLHIHSPYSVSGEGWYDANTQATVSLTSTVTTGSGTRDLFVQWSGDLSGVDPNQQIVMSSPRFVSAVWTTQYELRIESEYGHTAGSGWYAPGIQAAFLVDSLAIEGADGTRHLFTNWSGDASGTNPQGTVTMDAPKVIRANWATQYRLTFTTRGVRNGTSLTIIVDGQHYQVKAPQTISVWHDADLPISFSANGTVTDGFRRYVFSEWRNGTEIPVNSPRSVPKPETYTAVYKELSMFPCIIATVTFGSEVTPEVQFLRNFRDRLVLSTRAGSAFMNVFNSWYYSFSPQVADFIASHDDTRSPVRIALYPLIGILELSSVTYSAFAFSPEFAIVTAGILASALIGLIYLTPISLFLVGLRAKKKNRGMRFVRVCSISCLGALALLTLGELSGSFGLLAVATSALVLTTLVSAPLLFSSALVGLGSRLGLLDKLKGVSPISKHP